MVSNYGQRNDFKENLKGYDSSSVGHVRRVGFQQLGVSDKSVLGSRKGMKNDREMLP